MRDLTVLAVWEDERKLIRMGHRGYYVTQLTFFPVAGLSAERAMTDLLNGLTTKQKQSERWFNARDYVQARHDLSELRIEFTDGICILGAGR